MKTYVKFGSLMALIIGSLLWLAFSGVKDTQAYYKTIPELARMSSTEQHERLRVGGDVKPGSIIRGAAGVTFVLHQGVQTLNVLYSGTDPLPDTFKDNAQALADGRLGPDGVFQATRIQAKCASKYEAKPNQRGISHPSAPASRISSADSVSRWKKQG